VEGQPNGRLVWANLELIDAPFLSERVTARSSMINQGNPDLAPVVSLPGRHFAAMTPVDDPTSALARGGKVAHSWASPSSICNRYHMRAVVSSQGQLFGVAQGPRTFDEKVIGGPAA
jgi:hypothetical protein